MLRFSLNRTEPPEIKKKSDLCSLCLENTSKFHVVEDLMKEVFDVLRLKLSLNSTEEHIMCKKCVEHVEDLFDFKSRCLYTEDYLFPFIDSERVNLKEIYLELIRMEIDKQNNIVDGYEVCRLCLELVEKSFFLSLTEVKWNTELTKILVEYLPELNLQATNNSGICINCEESLRKYYKFAFRVSKEYKYNISKEYNIREDIIENGEDWTEPETAVLIRETEDIRKSADNSFKLNAREKQDPTPWKTLHECQLCQYKTNYLYNFQQHQIRIHEISNILFTCDICSYTTDVGEELKRHTQIHKDGGKFFKCDKCPYLSSHRSQFKRHLFIHKSINEAQQYKCDKCEYFTHRADSIKEHMETHKKQSERNLKKCPICSATVACKLKRHMLLHKDDSDEIALHKCSFCLYATPRSDTLKRHIMLMHKTDSEVSMYSCERCTYKTRDKSSLKSHMLRHMKSQEVVMYRCDLCEYQTKYKGKLKGHRSTHGDPGNVRMFRCYNCKYETNVKSTLKGHMKVHRKKSKIRSKNK